ncbi:MAG: response regulator transcription factor [Chloroflexi bacterium]|nr:response regulator transcription factor [Chloroflexota bacterium]
MNPIRVVIADDHDLVRSGLRIFFESHDDLRLVGEAANGLEAIAACQKYHPDVVLMDLVMPDMNGAIAIRRIHQQQPDLPIITLTNFQDENLILSAIQAGAISYLLKNVSSDELAQAIRDAYAGVSTLSPAAMEAIAAGPIPPVPPRTL